MYNIEFRPLSEIDLQEIVTYYDNLNPKITNKFLTEFENTIFRIEKMPKSFQKKLDNIRVAFLRRFRFGVYYKLYENEIRIIAILHTSRSPHIGLTRE